MESLEQLRLRSNSPSLEKAVAFPSATVLVDRVQRNVIALGRRVLPALCNLEMLRGTTLKRPCCKESNQDSAFFAKELVAALRSRAG